MARVQQMPHCRGGGDPEGPVQGGVARVGCKGGGVLWSPLYREAAPTGGVQLGDLTFLQVYQAGTRGLAPQS